MNIVSSIILAVAFILLGVNRIINIKKNTEALYEAVRFISSVKNNIRYLSMDYVSLVENAVNENYSYITFHPEITISDCVGEKVKGEFLQFVQKIGTTDEDGQLNFCDEYIERFKGFYNESASKEKSKVNVIGAISVLCVMCALVLGG
jgi:hypothetical protein